MSVFLKTGSDATTAAIRIARAYTGKIKVARDLKVYHANGFNGKSRKDRD